MNLNFSAAFLFLSLIVTFTVVSSSDVVILDSKNFEHLTQVSTGATTGDWLVKFYAPWCGHCKKLEPIYDQVAAKLKGEVNVAKVDVPANRDLGSRFDIKGFPSLVLFHKGKGYTYKGRRTVDDLVEFARGGFKVVEPEDVPPPSGIFGDFFYLYRDAYKRASTDLRKGRFFTIDVFLVFLPLGFVLLLVIAIFAPTPAPPSKKRSDANSSADSDSAADQNDDEDKNHAKND